MILNATSTRALGIVSPWRPAYRHANGLSGGQSVASYDLHSADDVTLWPLHECYIVSESRMMMHPTRRLHRNLATLETLHLPCDVGAWFALKSTHARLGVQQSVTWIDPGFRGTLVVELSNIGPAPVEIPAGSPIGQLVCKRCEPTDGYDGRYQGQVGAQGAILEAGA